MERETHVESAANSPDLDALWPAILDSLAPNQRVWLASSRPVMLAESTAVIAVPNEFTRTQLEGRLRTRLEDALSDSLNRPIRIAVSVDETLAPPEGSPQAPRPEGIPAAAQGPVQGAQQQDVREPRVDSPAQQPAAPAGHFGDHQAGVPVAHGLGEPGRAPRDTATYPHNDLSTNIQMGAASLTTGIPDSPLNPRYTFETFVIGSSNRFAHAAAVAVAEAPGKAYNPLLVYGDSGLGKTHLLHAIGHYVRSLFAGAKVRYVSSEEFTNEFINAIRDDRQDRFKRRYRDVDVLLIDDIQFLEGKIQTQEEFFHTLTRCTTPTSRS